VRLLDETGAPMATERVSFISPSADEATQTVLVKTAISSTLSGRVRAEQFVRVRVIWSANPALTVPLAAVTRIGGQHFVFVAEAADAGGLVARQRPVRVGSLVGNDYLLLEGLAAGDRVIVAGVQKIGEGSAVSAGPPAAGGSR
jgi:hypothetical protein